MTKPVILIVHAAWHCPAHYTPLIKALEGQGFTVLVPDLPTSNLDESAAIGKTVADDVACLHASVAPYLDAGHKAIVLAHSAGGIAGTVAVQGQTIAERASRGLKGGIVNVVWLAAVIPIQSNISLYDAAGKVWRGNEYYDVEEHLLPLKRPLAEDLFYHDLTPDAKVHAAKLLGHQSIAPFVDVIPYASQDVPVDKTYVICTDDRALTVPIQRFYAEQQGGKTVDIPSGHFPFLREDRLGLLVDIVVRAAEEGE